MVRCQLAAFCCLFTLARAQQPAESLAFDVASIKPSIRDGRGMSVSMRGGPGTGDPELFTCQNCSLFSLVQIAYDLKIFQVEAPSWLAMENFIVSAKVPPKITKDQFRAMQQNLLKERFHLAAHWDKREMPVYELAVAKNAPKFKPATPDPPSDEAAKPGPPPKLTSDSEGFPVLPPGRQPVMIMTGGFARWRVADESMDLFAAQLSNQVHGPVVDATGLKGKYDFTLSWTMGTAKQTGTAAQSSADPVVNEQPSSSLDIFTALREQLGLRLERKKAMVDVLVVDHMEKTPTEN